MNINGNRMKIPNPSASQCRPHEINVNPFKLVRLPALMGSVAVTGRGHPPK
jgi:hypothetical protein